MRSPFAALLIAGLGLALACPPGLVYGEESGLGALGDYERQAVEKVIENNGWRVASSPSGREIEEVHVVTLPVFSRRDGDLLQWFNRLHATTEPDVIRREVLLEPGDKWEGDKARETERNLRNPTFTSLAVVLPLERESDTKIDVLVVTRDIWSLRTNTDFEYQNGILSNLYVSASEHNLLGRHKSIGAAFEMDQGAFGFGPQYYDPNVLGTHVQFYSQARVEFERATGDFEGTSSDTQIAYPLWNLDRTWGADLQVTHADEVVREFRENRLLPYDDPDTTTVETVPYRYRNRTFDAEGRVHYAIGEKVEHRFSAGWRFNLQEPELPPDFPRDAALREAFRRDVLPPRERNSGPLVGYYVFQPTWRTYRNINTFDLPEEEQVGPYLQLEGAPILETFGSLSNFVELTGTAGWLIDIVRDGYFWFGGSATTRLRGERPTDNYLYGFARLATPDAWRIARFVARARADVYLRDRQNRLLFAGGQSGLRGFGIGAFAGEARFLGNVELRSMPLKAWFTRVGALLFWDVGHAAPSVEQLELTHDIGIGLRLLIPQANTVPARLDWAIPLDPRLPPFPGRISLGFGQIF